MFANLQRNIPCAVYLNRRRLSSSVKPKKEFDCIIVGGGIVGLATARELILRYPKLKFGLLEKEKELSLHQSKHNSGVIHAGIYYAPGSLKAKLCVEGLRRSYEYIEKNRIPHKKCGKLIVATDEMDGKRLMDLHDRSIKNNVPGVRLISSTDIRQIEPNCSGIQALYSPETGIVDWRTVALHFADDFRKCGGTIYTKFCVSSFSESTENIEYPVEICDLNNENSRIQSKYVITCAGLQSDRIAQKTGCSIHPRIVPFRGDYLKLKDDKSDMIKTNIYPVPDPRFPFLGVHFTPRVDGSVWLGPNAILSLDREGYGMFDVRPQDAFDSLSYLGFWKLASKYLSFGVKEMINAVYIERQVKLLQKYVPSLKASDVTRGPSGIRAQALNHDGSLVDDFVIDSSGQGIGQFVMHVRNAPSPAATSSLAIARMIADRAQKDFKWSTPVSRSEV